MLTYGDTITLLMTFFVLLLSMSVIDQSKFEETTEAIKEGALKQDAKKASPFETLREELDNIAVEKGSQDDVDVKRVAKGLTLEFASSTFYSAGSADIRPTAYPLLEEIANTLKDFTYENHQVEVEGHTDDVPINTARFPSNWELSVSRATNVIRYLMKRGVSKDRLKAAGYADIRPKAPNRDEAGNPIPENRALNRRIVVHVHRR